MTASVDGYVTHLDLRLGSQAVANQPALALVDTASFWVQGYFRETMIADVKLGDRAIVTVMTYPDRPVPGRVDCIGLCLSQSDGSTEPAADGQPDVPVDPARPAHSGARSSRPVARRRNARGTWFFEGDFPLLLLDGRGNLFAQGFATAEGEWMTTEFVPFSAIRQACLGAGSIQRRHLDHAPEGRH